MLRSSGKGPRVNVAPTTPVPIHCGIRLEVALREGQTNRPRHCLAVDGNPHQDLAVFHPSFHEFSRPVQASRPGDPQNSDPAGLDAIFSGFIGRNLVDTKVLIEGLEGRLGQGLCEFLVVVLFADNFQQIVTPFSS